MEEGVEGVEEVAVEVEGWGDRPSSFSEISSRTPRLGEVQKVFKVVIILFSV